MGLVVALRFLSWGGAVSALCAALLLESGRFPGLQKVLSLPVLLALYLLTSGHVLLMLRLNDWTTRALAMGPLLTLGLLALPAARSSVLLVGLALGCGLWLYLGALLRQAHGLGHARGAAWFLRTRQAVVVTTLACLVPAFALPAIVFGGMGLLGATMAGWRVWLRELRVGIAEQERL
jgi:hypothetical protein